MGRFLNTESKIARFFAAAWDLIVVNLLVLLTSIPVITIGVSLSAMYYVLVKRVRGEEGYIPQMYLRAFRENFKQATVLWLMALALIAAFRVDLFLIDENPETLGQGVRIAVIAVAIICFMIYQYVFPLQSHFANTVPMILRNSAVLSFSHFIPATLVMSAVWIVPWLLFRYSLAAFPLLIMLGISLPAYICTKMVNPIFRKLEPEPEEDADSAFCMSEEDLSRFGSEMLGREETVSSFDPNNN